MRQGELLCPAASGGEFAASGYQSWRSNCWKKPITTAAHITIAAISMTHLLWWAPLDDIEPGATRIMEMRCCN